MSRSLLGGRKHQITHANVDIERNGVLYTGIESLACLNGLNRIDNEKKKVISVTLQTRLWLQSFFLVEFDTLELEIFVICWIGSVDPVDGLCLTNQIYSALLNAFELKKKW